MTSRGKGSADGRGSRRGAPTPLSASIPEVLSLLDLPGVETLVRLSRAWADVAGPIVAAKALPDRLRGKVLTVRVENHAWAQELSLRKPILLSKLSALLGEGVVTEIRFEASPLPAAPKGAEAKKKRRLSLPDLPPLPDPEGLSGLGDPELQRILRSIQAKSAALRTILPDAPPPGGDR